MNKKTGFTFVELITVIALIGIIGIIATPRSGNMNTFKNESKSIEILSLLNQAHSLSISQRRNIYTIKNGTLLSLCYLNQNPCLNNNKVKQQNKSLETIIDTTITFPVIQYNTNGTTNNSLNLNLNGITLKIDSLTGYSYI